MSYQKIDLVVHKHEMLRRAIEVSANARIDSLSGAQKRALDELMLESAKKLKTMIINLSLSLEDC